MNDIETHPFEPFLPDGARLLFLGTFPPQRKRWSMDFYYPNFINDFWRILALIYREDAGYFIKGKGFDMDKITDFCKEKGFALFDTATEVRRLKDNASDKFLEIVRPTDIRSLLRRIPECAAVVTTGSKASEVFSAEFGTPMPAMCGYSPVEFEGRMLRHYRLPSSSRAYPMPLAEKAACYSRMFRELGML